MQRDTIEESGDRKRLQSHGTQTRNQGLMDDILSSLSTILGRTSPIVLEFFFEKLYEQYDLRFVYGAPALASRTRRLEWAPDSPALLDPIPNLDYEPRLSADLP